MLGSLFNKVEALKAYNFIKKRPQNRCFPANIVKLLGTVFYGKLSVAAPVKGCYEK